ncbi:monovalent cation/H(+) antiporter subunit G [Macrococcus carouselicus]|uniref:Na+/H+ antiporter subunit G n=1 Tax=Macrococcus carouselicus TaxID=69969 RepID=A0A9Q8CN02_9STAP|nr:monovalent cation/H(+) antiporter subunit G [Macrococcus carouselicus]TDM03750.1 Na+/H+ antiporter subunit G [Macrococcus carouselicus]
MSEMILNGLAILFILVGSLFSLVSAIGLFRLPDVYTRAHAASKASTLGVMFIMVGVMFFFLGKDHVFQPSLLLAVLFIFMTGPIGGHLIMRSAYNNGVKYTDSTIRDDLKDAE